ncbi:Ltp family lipoprotein [Butyrivibrio sp. VCD2006]|uniref:Ltp family lipoprotein n=1 Tax=Butyrivibrio sp. VCD2006 TaxID=1280664 RepID=UPI0003F9950D|nr:Ltp family lipoprotein [Butyrivibrio sp. VCD2006]
MDNKSVGTNQAYGGAYQTAPNAQASQYQAAHAQYQRAQTAQFQGAQAQAQYQGAQAQYQGAQMQYQRAQTTQAQTAQFQNAPTYKSNGNVAYKEDSAVNDLKLDKTIHGFIPGENNELYPYEAEIIIEKDDKKKPVFMAAIGASIATVALIGICLGIVGLGSRNHTQVDPVAPVVVTTQVTAKDVKDMTPGEKQAIREAQDQLSSTPYSRAALIDQLTRDYIGYTETEATVAVDYLEAQGLVDWNEECLRWARFIRDGSYYSRQGMYDMLTYVSCGYTPEQAEYAISYLETNKEIDWYEEAKNQAKYLTDIIDYDTKEDLIRSLVEYDNFTEEQAQYAVKNMHFPTN